MAVTLEDSRKVKCLITDWQVADSPEVFAQQILKIILSSEFDAAALKLIMKIGFSHEKYHTPSFIKILLHVLQSDFVKEIDDVNFDQLDVINLNKLSSKLNLYNKNMFNTAIMRFLDTKLNIDERIFVTNTLIKQMSTAPEIAIKEYVVAIKSMVLMYDNHNRKQLLLHTVAFQILKHMTHELSHDFLRDFYNINVRCKIFSHSDAQNKDLFNLDSYMSNIDIEIEAKHNLLETLCVILYNGFTLDTMIFELFPSNEWHRELLVYVLLGKTLQCERELDKCQITYFMTEISALNNLINVDYNSSTSDNNYFDIKHAMEEILKFLINEQEAHSFDLRQVTNILIILQMNLDKIHSFLSYDRLTPEFLMEMQNVWVEKTCVIKIKNINDAEIKRFSELVSQFDASAVSILFEKMSKSMNKDDFLEFTEVLVNCPLTQHNKIAFINQLSYENVKLWKFELFHLIIRLQMFNEFPNYSGEKLTKSIPTDEKPSSKMAGILCKIENRIKKILSINGDSSNFMTCNDKAKSAMKNLLSDLSTDDAILLNNDMLELEPKLVKLVTYKLWSLEPVISLIINIDSWNKVRELSKTIDVIIEYGISEKHVLPVFKESRTDQLEKNIFELALKQSFSGTYEKEYEMLLQELIDLNSNKDPAFLHKIRKMYRDIENSFNNHSIADGGKKVNAWNAKDVKAWAMFHGNPLSGVGARLSSFADILAVIIRALQLSLKITPRPIQIISVLLMLNPEKGKGRLAQINTGEGKTTVIAMIAAYHGLHGHAVDVVTTSPVLAIPQSELLQDFYRMLNLSVSHNVDNTNGYKADICYGPVRDFQADVLREKCMDPMRKFQRKCDIIIVDEVDNMFIDGNKHIIMLSDNMPGMNHLETLLAAIVIQISQVRSCVQEVDGKTYLMQPRSRVGEDGKVSEEEVVDAVPLDCTVVDFVKDATEKHIRKLVRDIETEEGYPEVKIPIHLRELVCKIQIPKWIHNALLAKYNFKNKQHYILRRGKVMPVDTTNTGVVQENQHWSDGIHQFLQIKHGAKIYPEALTNNYISNTVYFNKYGNNIYGLTGTLGNASCSSFLEKVYGVDTVIVPPFKKKQHVSLNSTVLSSKPDQFFEIVKNCIAKLKCGRAALIITRYIDEVDELHAIFSDLQYDTPKILLFKTEQDAEVVNKVINPGEVILTTNVAGRGTDIKVNQDVEKSGGLHVCLTFLPDNTRVEEQNVGRTSRTGNRGTSQMILFDKNGRDMRYIRKERDDAQNTSIAEAENDVDYNDKKEMIFDRFLCLLENVEGRCRRTKKIEIRAVKERFAIWLKQQEKFLKSASKDEISNKYNDFKNMILTDDRQGKLIKNPYFYVLTGKKYMEKELYYRAIAEFGLAIDLDKNFAENAFYNRGYCYLTVFGAHMNKNKLMIDKAIDDFETSRKLIQLRENDLHLIQRASEAEVFSKQVQRKMNLYNIQKQAIDLAIGPDINQINSQIEEIEKRLQTEQNPKNKEEMKEALDSLKTERKKEGVIQKARYNGRDISTELVNVNDCLPENEINLYVDEIEEFQGNGFIGSFTVTEIKPIDFWAVFGLMVLGLGQLIAGAALAVYTLGAGMNIAISMISSGIGDLITCIKNGIINRDFSWGSWAIEKAITLTVAVICAGMSAIKDVASTAVTGIRNIGSKVLTETVKNGWKLVAKKVAVEIGKGVAKQIVEDLAQYGIDKTLIPEIQAKLVEAIEVPIRHALLSNKNVEKLLKLDEENGNRNFESYIQSVAFQLLDDKYKNQLLSIGQQIATGVLDGKVKYFAAARKVTEALLAVEELSTFVPKFITQMESSIETKMMEIEKNQIKKDEETNSQKTDDNNTDSQNTNIVENAESTKETVTESVSQQLTTDDTANICLTDSSDSEEEVENTDRPKVSNLQYLTKQVVNGVSLRMLSTIKNKLVSPTVQGGVSYGMGKITSSLDSALDHQIENYRSLKRVIHHQDKGYQHSSERNDEMSARDVNTANKLIEEAQAGGKCGLPHMGALSDVVDRPIEVYNEEGKLKFVIGENKKGEPVRVQHHKQHDHYTKLGGQEAKEISAAKNMCLFDVVGEQANVHPDTLKSHTLNWMSDNKQQFSRQTRDITRLQMFDNLKLCLGGVRPSKDIKEAGEMLNASENKTAHTSNKNKNYKPNPGHPRKHAYKPNDPSSVDEYSKTDVVYGKSGFDSYEDQNAFAHYAMNHAKAKKPIAEATKGKDFAEIKLDAKDLKNLPPHLKNKQGSQWIDGKKEYSSEITGLTLLLRHREGEKNNPDAPAFIQTFYPKLKKPPPK